MLVDLSCIEYITNKINDFIFDRKKIYATIDYEKDEMNIHIKFRKSLRYFNNKYYNCLDIVNISVYPEDQKIGQNVFDVILSMGYNLYVESIMNSKLESILRKKGFYYCSDPSFGCSNMIFINSNPKTIKSDRLDFMKKSINLALNNFLEETHNDSITEVNT